MDNLSQEELSNNKYKLTQEKSGILSSTKRLFCGDPVKLRMTGVAKSEMFRLRCTTLNMTGAMSSRA